MSFQSKSDLNSYQKRTLDQKIIQLVIQGERETDEESLSFVRQLQTQSVDWILTEYNRTTFQENGYEREKQFIHTAESTCVRVTYVRRDMDESEWIVTCKGSIEELVNSIPNMGSVEGSIKEILHTLQIQTKLIPSTDFIMEIPKFMMEKKSSLIKDFTMEVDHELWNQCKHWIDQKKISLSAYLNGIWGILLYRYTRMNQIHFLIEKNYQIEGQIYRYPSLIEIIVNEKDKLTSYFQDMDKLEQRLHQSPCYLGSFDDSKTNVLIQFTEDGDHQIPVYREWNHVPFICCVHISDQGLQLRYQYDQSEYDDVYVQKIHGHLIELMKSSIIQNQIDQINLIPQEEQEMLLQMGSSEKSEYLTAQNVTQCFECIVEKYPSKLAISFKEDEISYFELNQLANAWATQLISYGIQPGDVVAFMLDRSPHMIIAILGILKAGATYLPIDPSYPESRKQFMIEDAKAKLFITDQEVCKLGRLSIPVIHTSNISYKDHFIPNINVKSDISDLIYIIYTSGSTGKPKGIMTTHQNVLKTIYQNGFESFSSQDRMLQLANVAFDGSVIEIFGALLNGGELVLVSKEDVLNPWRLTEIIKEKQITHTFMTTGLFHTIVDVEIDACKNMKKIMFGGEKASLKHVRKAYQALGNDVLLHAYGPTETTVFATTYTISDWDDSSDVLPIGKPIHNTQCYVVDPQGNLMPVGVPGELWISGDGLAKGYLGRPDLTEQCFIDHPFQANAKIYRSGDLVKWLPDGNLQFVDRMDQQVKIRGHRIELGEVEKGMNSHPFVKEVIVIAKTDDDGHSALYGYYIAEESLSTGQFREYLQAQLPDYMIPSYLIQMEQFPLNQNGKVDRKKLPLPDLARTDRTEPETETETRLSNIYCEVLHIDQVSTTASFSELGGHSLKAMVLIAKIQEEFGVKLSVADVFESSTVKKLGEKIDLQEATDLEHIPIADSQEVYPTSSAQARMFMIQELDQDSTSYNVTYCYKVEGNLDWGHLEESLYQMIQRHESLRTSFEYYDGNLVQRIHEQVSFQIGYKEITSLKDVNQQLAALIQPFDLSQAPLMRVYRVVDEQGNQWILLDYHHIICDGISIGIFNQELSKLYTGQSLSPLSIQYKDYAVWQQKRLGSIEGSNQLVYWKDQLSGELPMLEFPTDFVRPPVQKFEGDKLSFTLDQQTRKQLELLAKESDSTLYMVLLSAYYTLLSKYTNQYDIIIGSPVAGRTHNELFPQIGMFVNTLPIRIQSTPTENFQGLLQQVRKNLLDAYQHSEVALEDLIEALDFSRDASRNPLFDTIFVLQNMDLTPLQVAGSTCIPTTVKKNHAKLDLTWEVYDQSEELQIVVEYSTHLFRQETIQRMIGHFQELLRDLIQHSNQSLVDLSWVTNDEKIQILEKFNDTDSYYPESVTIHSLFERSVSLYPNQIAVASLHESLTYQELNERANGVARLLLERGLQKEQFVSVMVERSVETMVAMIAIWKAGGAYVPIDPKYPLERIEHMLTDSESSWLIAKRSHEVPSHLKDRVIWFDDLVQESQPMNVAVEVDPSQLAYMIYTSGSTGLSKGVIVDHRSALNFYQQGVELGISKPEERFVSVFSLSFDGSMIDILFSLLSGSTLYTIDSDWLLTPEFMNWMREEKISVIGLTPSMGRVLPKADLPDLKIMYFGGEVLTTDVVKEWGYGRRIINVYGPTETVVVATWEECTPDKDQITIGKPIINKKIYIVDEQERIVPIGVPGELYIGGVGVASGYWKRPELTRERFVENPFIKGEQIYKSGDIARWLPDGSIEFIGRKDDQVKIRGHRIELEEINVQILQSGLVQESVVVTVEDETGTKDLCAYVVWDGQAQKKQLKEQLREILPHYMIPAHIVDLDELPLTPNGKVNKKSLPKPNMDQVERHDLEKPTTEIEKILAEVWKSVLKINEIGIDDHFLELGGDSIKAMQMAARLAQYQLKVHTRDLYAYPTIRELAPQVKAEYKKKDYEPVTGDVLLTPIQKWFFQLDIANYHHWNQSMIWSSKERWDESMVREAILELIQHHDILRVKYSIQQEEVKQWIEVEGRHQILTQVYDVRDADHEQEAVRTFADQIQRSLHIEHGPIGQVVIFQGKEADHLFFTLHHLIIDGVSWRILLEDFFTRYESKRTKVEQLLPPKTASYQKWSQALHGYAHSEELKKEASYWDEIDQSANQSFSDQSSSESSYENSAVVTMNLDPVLTKQLLTEAHHAYHTEMNDLLLAALAKAVQSWKDWSELKVWMEGHGREEIFEEIDLTRTVGWFTAIYPVVLPLASADQDSQIIKEVKEILRKVPNKGLGYGVLRFLGEQISPLSTIPPISFNYLGQFDDQDGLSGLGQTNWTGDAFDQSTPLMSELEVNGMVLGGELQFTFRFDPKRLETMQINRLVQMFEDKLIQIITHCVSQEENEHTISDFSASDLDSDELDAFLDSLS